MDRPDPAVCHRTIVVVDVEGFGDRRRTLLHQLAVRRGLYGAVRLAFDACGVPWADCDHEDRGDSVFLLAPAEVPKATFVGALPLALAAALREHNASHSAEEQIRLRMAVHAGDVAYDEHGVTAASVNLTFRLVDAPPLKAALAESAGLLALITSDWFFEDVVRQRAELEPTTYRPVQVAVKETVTVGWICLPDSPYSRDSSALGAPPREWAAEPVPRQLPSAPRSFTGRVAELAALSSVFAEAGGQGRPVVISAIAGAGGIGKSWLALHWAHQHADRFPDGQVFLDLHGFSSAAEPTSPQTAIRALLNALGIEQARIPTDFDAQVALYRSTTSGRRMLLVLDNARTTTQVAPLLPGGGRCAVLITSRNRLAGLITNYGARSIRVDALSGAEARELLASRLGTERLDAEPGAVAELLDCCAGLPLALSIIAARAQAHPGFPLAVLAAELRDTAGRLGALADDDPTASLPAVLSWSYRALAAEHQKVFALLGIAAGPDIGLPAVASLTRRSPEHVRAALRALEDAHLLQQHRPGRYRFHDLVRLYATECARRHLAKSTRTAATRRLISFYLHSAVAADQALAWHREPIQLDPAPPGCRAQPIDGETTAWAWFTAEYAVLVATQQLAAALDCHTPVWQLAWALDTFHHRSGYLKESVEVWRTALTSADQLGQPDVRIRVNRILGRAYTWAGLSGNAVRHLELAIELAKQTDDHAAQAYCHRSLASAWEQRGDNHNALDHAIQALRIFQTARIPGWEADALNAVGWYQARLGRYAEAESTCHAALAMAQANNDRIATANASDSLGYIAHQTGHHAEALNHYHTALSSFTQVGTRYFLAGTYDRLGETHHAMNQPDHARIAWRQALELYRAQHRTADADRVQRHLDDLPAGPAGWQIDQRDPGQGM